MNRKLLSDLKGIISRLLLLFLLMGCGLASCTYHTNDFEPPEIREDVSFNDEIIPIFEARCNSAGCHNGAIPPDLRREVAYNEIIDGGYVTDTSAAENNVFFQKIDVGGSMYIYATDQDRIDIKIWIEEGALNN